MTEKVWCSMEPNFYFSNTFEEKMKHMKGLDVADQLYALISSQIESYK